MKLPAFVVATLFVSGVFAAPATPPQEPQTPATPATEVQIGVNEAYVPGGFDSTSDAYVVASGLFSNGCYSWSRAEVKNISEFEHEVTTFAKVSPGMCIMVLVPYQKEIRLGRLAPGSHTLRFVGGDATFLEKTFEIE